MEAKGYAFKLPLKRYVHYHHKYDLYIYLQVSLPDNLITLNDITSWYEYSSRIQ